MTDDETRLEDDARLEEKRTRLEGSDPGRTVLEGGARQGSEGLEVLIPSSNCHREEGLKGSTR